MTTSRVGRSLFGSRSNNPRSQKKCRSLSRREREILELIEAGQASKQIAGSLKISTNTVNNHRASILAKLGAHSALEALRIYKHLE